MRIDQQHDAEMTVARAVGVLALAGIALIHLLDLPGKMQEVPYLGFAYILLIISTLALAGLLVVRHRRTDWLLIGGLAAAVALGFVVNRSIGLPMATADVGNWLEPLGLAALFVELVLLPLAAWAYLRPTADQSATQRAETPAADRSATA